MSEDKDMTRENKVGIYTRRGIVAAAAGYLGLKAAERIVGAQGGIPLPPLEPGKVRTILPVATGGITSSPNSEPPVAQPPTATPETQPIQSYNSLKEMADMPIRTYYKEKEVGGKVRKFEIKHSPRWNTSAIIKSEKEQEVIDNIALDLANQNADRVVIAMLESVEESPPEISADDWLNMSYTRTFTDATGKARTESRAHGYYALKTYSENGEKVVVVGYAKPATGFLNEDPFKAQVTGRLGIYLSRGTVAPSGSDDPKWSRHTSIYPLYQTAIQVINS